MARTQPQKRSVTVQALLPWLARGSITNQSRGVQSAGKGRPFTSRPSTALPATTTA